VVRLNKKMHPLFLSAFLNSDGGQVQFAKFRHDFGTPNINISELADQVIVSLPPLSVQLNIVSRINYYENEIFSARETVLNSQRSKSDLFPPG